MRYVVQHKKAGYITLLILALSTFIQIFLILFMTFKFLSNEMFPADIRMLVVGNPEEFLEGMSMLQIVEKIHIELFLLSFVFLTVSSINLRLQLGDNFKILFSLFSFVLILLYIFSLLLMFLSPFILSYVYFVSLILIFLTLSVINFVNIIFFLTGKVK